MFRLLLSVSAIASLVGVSYGIPAKPVKRCTFSYPALELHQFQFLLPSFWKLEH
jgi:hypothetical protein